MHAAAATKRRASAVDAAPPKPRRTAAQASNDIAQRRAHRDYKAAPLIENPEFQKARARVAKWSKRLGDERGGDVGFTQTVRDVGLVVIEELAAVRALDAAAAQAREGSEPDDLTALTEEPSYLVNKTESRGSDSRMGYVWENIAFRCASLKGAQYQHPGNLLMSPQLSTPAAGGVPQKRQRYGDGNLKPMIVTDLNQKATLDAAGELVDGVMARRLPKFGSDEFHDLLVDRMERVRKKPRGDVWGQNVDLALTDSGTELLELKTGGEPGQKGFEGEIKSLVAAALAFNDPDVQLRFGVAKPPLAVIARTYPSWIDFYSPNRPVLSGSAYWEHVLPGAVTYEDFKDCIRQCGQAFKKDVVQVSAPTRKRRVRS